MIVTESNRAPPSNNTSTSNYPFIGSRAGERPMLNTRKIHSMNLKVEMAKCECGAFYKTNDS